MRVLIAGAGGMQGSRCAELLCADPGVSRVVLADLPGSRGAEVAARLGDKTEWAELDLRDVERLAELLARCDLFCNLAGPYVKTGEPGISAALQAGTPYVDINDESNIVDLRVRYDAVARERGVPLLTGMGVYGLMNPWARHAAGTMTAVDRLGLHWVISAGSFTRHLWRTRLDFFRSPAPAIRGGRLVTMEPGTGEEDVDFGPPLGGRMVCSLDVNGVHMIDRNLGLFNGAREVDAKGGYLSSHLSGFLQRTVTMGLAGDGLLDPLADYLASDAFMSTGQGQRLARDEVAAGSGLGMHATVEGRVGEVRTRRVLRYASRDRNHAIAASAAVGVRLLAGGLVPAGMVYPEELDVEAVLREFAGFVTWTERTEAAMEGQGLAQRP